MAKGRIHASEPDDQDPVPDVSVAGTGDAFASSGAAAVTGFAGPAPSPGTSAHVSHTGNAIAAAGGNANTGYQHIDTLVVLQPPVTTPQPPPAPQLPRWTIARPRELAHVVAAVCEQPGETVGITTGLEGAGGFGKSTLARMACADERVCQHFDGRIYIVTIGRDVRERAAIATKVVETIRFITGHSTTYTDPAMAGDELGRLLDQHPQQRTLLVLDDVWDPAQLDPFLRGGKRCVRLVTTRTPAVLPDGAARVQVDQMTRDQALTVLSQDLPSLPDHLARGLITATGRWPLLLRLANRWIADQVDAGAEITTAAEHLLTLLGEQGPAAVDRLRAQPDPADPTQRAKLVRATVQAATGLLAAVERQCLAELAIFAEGEPLPVLTAARLWQATAGLNEPRARGLCHDLNSLSLVTVDPEGGGSVILHDVIRDYLRHELGCDRITQLNAALMDAVAAGLPAAEPLSGGASGARAAWWTLAENPGSTADAYLADHAVSHLLAAGRTDEAEALACDLHWVEARLHQHGPTAPWSDCARIPTTTAARRAHDLAQAAHLLAPTVPGHALTAVLHSRLGPLRGWADQVDARQRQITQPVLRNRWSPPDLPHPALRRVLACRHTVHSVMLAPDGSWLATLEDGGRIRVWDADTGARTAVLTGPPGTITSVAVAPDGTWLATGDDSGTVRIWDRDSGAQIAVLTGHPGPITNIVPAPDGTWLATVGAKDATARIWDPDTGSQTAVLTGPGERTVTAVAVAPDGTWLATGDDSGTVRIWDPDTGTQSASLTGPTSWINALAIAPDGAWLAAGHNDGTVRIWDSGSRRQRAALTGHETRINFYFHDVDIAIAPDGMWLATTAGFDPIVRIWNPVTGTQIATLAGPAHSIVTAIAVAPDGTWLATGDDSGTVRIWDPDTGSQTAALTGHVGEVRGAVVAPDGTWLATVGAKDATVRLWDPTVGSQTTLTRHPGHQAPLTAVAVAPDGTWFVTVGDSPGETGRFDLDRGADVRIWDVAAGTQIAHLVGHTGAVTAVAVAPDGTWLATADENFVERVRIWDPVTGAQTRTLTGPSERTVTAVAISPDGTWLVTACTGLKGAMLSIWDLATGARSARIDLPCPVTTVVVAPDGTWLATADAKKGTVRLWDLATGTQTSALTANISGAGRTQSLTISPDGVWLATVDAKTGTVRIWDSATGAQTNAFRSKIGRVTAATIGPDGTRLATLISTGYEHEGAVQILDSDSGAVVTMTRTDGKLHACAWMPDGLGLIAAGRKGVYCYQFSPGTPHT